MQCSCRSCSVGPGWAAQPRSPQARGPGPPHGRNRKGKSELAIQMPKSLYRQLSVGELAVRIKRQIRQRRLADQPTSRACDVPWLARRVWCRDKHALNVQLMPDVALQPNAGLWMDRSGASESSASPQAATMGTSAARLGIGSASGAGLAISRPCIARWWCALG